MAVIAISIANIIGKAVFTDLPNNMTPPDAALNPEAIETIAGIIEPIPVAKAIILSLVEASSSFKTSKVFIKVLIT